jgi:hypothetical protein
MTAQAHTRNESDASTQPWGPPHLDKLKQVRARAVHTCGPQIPPIRQEEGSGRGRGFSGNRRSALQMSPKRKRWSGASDHESACQDAGTRLWDRAKRDAGLQPLLSISLSRRNSFGLVLESTEDFSAFSPEQHYS